MSKLDETVLIGMGSNLGDRRRHLVNAITELGSQPGMEIEGASRIWVTAAWGGPPGQSPFYNAVLKLRAREIAPEFLLELVLDIERRSGRVRTIKNGPRTLDLDILLFGSRCIASPGLTIPHVGLHERSFVLGPAAEVAGDLVHPALGLTLAALDGEVGREGVLQVQEEKDWFHVVGHTSG